MQACGARKAIQSLPWVIHQGLASLDGLVTSLGYTVETFGNAAEYN